MLLLFALPQVPPPSVPYKPDVTHNDQQGAVTLHPAPMISKPSHSQHKEGKTDRRTVRKREVGGTSPGRYRYGFPWSGAPSLKEERRKRFLFQKKYLLQKQTGYLFSRTAQATAEHGQPLQRPPRRDAVPGEERGAVTPLSLSRTRQRLLRASPRHPL